MGGGDLNLKKSWHPQTMKNQEKVWKAEQAEKAEKRKLYELRKEIADEKCREDLKKIGQTSGVLAQNDSLKLEWMYKGPAQLLNREEYLLGRSIDKSFEQLDAEEKIEKEKQVIGVTVPKNHVEHECIPFSIRQYRSVQSTEQVDLQRKIMEDPLMLIKQKELESRKKILENPVKLKELHRLLKSEKTYKPKCKKLKKYKNKKDKKKSRHSSHETSDEELDKMLAKQYKKIQNAFGKSDDGEKLDINKLLKVKYEKLSEELESASTKKKNRKRSKSTESSSTNSSHSSYNKRRENVRQVSKDNYGLTSRDGGKLRQNQRRPYSIRNTNAHKSGAQTGVRASERKDTVASTSRNWDSNEGNLYSSDKKFHQKGKLTDDEKEKRRQEMMQNAIWRDEERSRTVKKYREECDKERKQHESNEFDKTFINKELQKAMSNQTSMESRIKSNINNIQRSSRAMDTNFAKR